MKFPGLTAQRRAEKAELEYDQSELFHSHRSANMLGSVSTGFGPEYWNQSRSLNLSHARPYGAVATCLEAIMQVSSAEWLPASLAPSDQDLEVCVLDYDGIVHALAFPCNKDGTDWVDARSKKRADLQPTHWRMWERD